MSAVSVIEGRSMWHWKSLPAGGRLEMRALLEFHAGGLGVWHLAERVHALPEGAEGDGHCASRAVGGGSVSWLSRLAGCRGCC